jgi:hypothetical protein
MTRNKFSRAFLCASALLSLGGCSSAKLAPRGAVVKVVNSISEQDLARYETVGSFETKGMQSIEDCYRDLRNQAGDSGAEIIRITSTETDYCDIDFYNKNVEKRCYKMLGDGFRSKIKSDTASTKSAAQPQI